MANKVSHRCSKKKLCFIFGENCVGYESKRRLDGDFERILTCLNEIFLYLQLRNQKREEKKPTSRSTNIAHTLRA